MARWIVWGGLAAALLYCLALGALIWFQRDAMYFPQALDTTPAKAGFEGAESFTLNTSDNQHLVAWHKRAKPGKPTILYFYGNGGVLARMSPRFNALTDGGNGLMAVDYRGYGGSTGQPTEEGLLLDGEAAYIHLLAEGVPPDRIVVYGESLGSGVAVALAARHRPASLILEAPFSSAVDVAAGRYWMFPVRALMRDQFRSDLRIKDVLAPILILHGENDDVVPVKFGRRLFNLAPFPKEFMGIPGSGHALLLLPGVAARVKDWLAGTLPPGEPG